MKLRRRPRTHWLGRVLRGRRLDRNPLRRRSDRVETAMLGVLFAVFLAGVPFAAHAAGNWAYATSAREAQAQRASLHQVPATLLKAAPAWNANGAGVPEVDARWRAPDGQVRTGEVFVPVGAAAGSTVLVWTDRTGRADRSSPRARPGGEPGPAGRGCRRRFPRHRPHRGRLAGPQVPGSPQAGRVGRRLAGDWPAVEPAALGPAFAVTEVPVGW